ncbi:hypothetical protein OIV83_003352 [Microbotryomycetes sp. JL201]|nr:hypothetical protein OIV83_003352 [Microbotryomycetes sp. JL201]
MPKAVEPDRIPIHSASQLQAELATLLSWLQKDETEHSWEQIDKALKRFHAVVRGGAAKQFPDDLARGLRDKPVATGIIRCLISERTRLSGTALDLIAATTRLGSQFQPLMSTYLPVILRLLCRTNKLYIARASATVTSIILHTHLIDVLKFIAQEWRAESGKSSSFREKAAEAIACMLGSSTAPISTATTATNGLQVEKDALEKRIDDLEWLIKVGATDREPKVRAEMKKCWEVYKITWPERVASFTAPMTPVIRRYLNVAANAGAGAAPSASAAARSAPVVKKPRVPSALSSSTSIQTTARSAAAAVPSTSTTATAHRIGPTASSLSRSTASSNAKAGPSRHAPVVPAAVPLPSSPPAPSKNAAIGLGHTSRHATAEAARSFSASSVVSRPKDEMSGRPAATAKLSASVNGGSERLTSLEGMNLNASRPTQVRRPPVEVDPAPVASSSSSSRSTSSRPFKPSAPNPGATVAARSASSFMSSSMMASAAGSSSISAPMATEHRKARRVLTTSTAPLPSVTATTTATRTMTTTPSATPASTQSSTTVKPSIVGAPSNSLARSASRTISNNNGAMSGSTRAHAPFRPQQQHTSHTTRRTAGMAGIGMASKSTPLVVAKTSIADQDAVPIASNNVKESDVYERHDAIAEVTDDGLVDEVHMSEAARILSPDQHQIDQTQERIVEKLSIDEPAETVLLPDQIADTAKDETNEERVVQTERLTGPDPLESQEAKVEVGRDSLELMSESLEHKNETERQGLLVERRDETVCARDLQEIETELAGDEEDGMEDEMLDESGEAEILAEHESEGEDDAGSGELLDEAAEGEAARQDSAQETAGKETEVEDVQAEHVQSVRIVDNGAVAGLVKQGTGRDAELNIDEGAELARPTEVEEDAGAFCDTKESSRLDESVEICGTYLVPIDMNKLTFRELDSATVSTENLPSDESQLSHELDETLPHGSGSSDIDAALCETFEAVTCASTEPSLQPETARRSSATTQSATSASCEADPDGDMDDFVQSCSIVLDTPPRITLPAVAGFVRLPTRTLPGLILVDIENKLSQTQDDLAPETSEAGESLPSDKWDSDEDEEDYLKVPYGDAIDETGAFEVTSPLRAAYLADESALQLVESSFDVALNDLNETSRLDSTNMTEAVQLYDTRSDEFDAPLNDVSIASDTTEIATVIRTPEDTSIVNDLSKVSADTLAANDGADAVQEDEYQDSDVFEFERDRRELVFQDESVLSDESSIVDEDQYNRNRLFHVQHVARDSLSLNDDEETGTANLRRSARSHVALQEQEDTADSNVLKRSLRSRIVTVDLNSSTGTTSGKSVLTRSTRSTSREVLSELQL